MRWQRRWRGLALGLSLELARSLCLAPALALTLTTALLFQSGAQAQDFLEPDKAFELRAQRDGDRLNLHWTIAPGYHLYADRIEVKALDLDVTLGAPVRPAGVEKFDPNFNRTMTMYTGSIDVTVPILRAPPPPASVRIDVVSQGCADAGLCYPPQQRTLLLPPGAGPAKASVSTSTSTSTSESASASAAPEPVLGDDERIAGVLGSGSLWRIALLFFGLGLLLSFTPCVLPMIPILSSIIVGSAGAASTGSRARGFALSLAYSAGMILVYTGMGIAAGLLGEGLSATLQKPWVIALFSGLLFAFGLAMFDVFTLQAPAALQNRLTAVTNRIPGGRFTGVFAMGGLSALIVGPCVAAPLAGALVYISKTGNVLVGGVALFCLSLGMSQPLLLTGVSAGRLLPRAGAWMDGVKRCFGLLLFATALWLANAILPSSLFMTACALLLLMSAIWLGAFGALPAGAGLARTAGKAAGLVCAALALLQIVGVASGGSDALQPIRHLTLARPVPGGAVAGAALADGAGPGASGPGASGTGGAGQGGTLRFRTIGTDAELSQVLAGASGPVLLDFYADWCTSCKEMEHGPFSDPRVISLLSKATLLRADVTRNTDQDRALMRRFSLFGPPAMVALSPDGREIPHTRVVGYKPADPLLAQLAPVFR